MRRITVGLAAVALCCSAGSASAHPAKHTAWFNSPKITEKESAAVTRIFARRVSYSTPVVRCTPRGFCKIHQLIDYGADKGWTFDYWAFTWRVRDRLFAHSPLLALTIHVQLRAVDRAAVEVDHRRG